MKGSNIALIAALAAGIYLLSKSNGGNGLQSVFDNLSNWLGGSPSGSGTNTPTSNVVSSGTPAGVLDKNSIPPSSNPAIIAQVNQISTYQVGVAVNAANALVKSGAWTPATAAASIANATNANAAYWQTKGF
jgi:hypothetical protein